MSQSVSPYALLRASKPKPAPTVVTAYDLYSAAQLAPQTTEQVYAEPVQQPARSPAMQAPTFSQAKRTHYIADIKARHNQAIRKSSLNR